jgi:hypothetical protein
MPSDNRQHIHLPIIYNLSAAYPFAHIIIENKEKFLILSATYEGLTDVRPNLSAAYPFAYISLRTKKNS